MRYTPRHLFTAFIGLILSVFAFATPATASVASPTFDAYGDSPPIYVIAALPAVYDTTVADTYALPNAPSWKDAAAEYDTLVVRDLSKRTGLSYRQSRQPNVKGAPLVM